MMIEMRGEARLSSTLFDQGYLLSKITSPARMCGFLHINQHYMLKIRFREVN
jgi:hypothetical protein